MLLVGMSQAWELREWRRPAVGRLGEGAWGTAGLGQGRVVTLGATGLLGRSREHGQSRHWVWTRRTGGKH